MKKIKCFVITFFFISLLLRGCITDASYANEKLNSPINNNLNIEGIWNAKEYSVLDKNISTDDEIYKILKSDIIFKNNSMKIGKSEFSQVDYRLKVVNSSYTISYEAKYKIEDLPIEKDKVYVYSIMYNNNVLGEMIFATNELSYLYYQGVIYTISYNRELTDADKDSNNIAKQEEDYVKPIVSQGMYLGLKTERNEEDNQRENYRTLFISSKSGELMPVKERKNIIIPKRQGIWILEPKIYQDSTKKTYYEYFDAKPIDSTGTDETKIIDTSKIQEESIVQKNITYVGPEYMSTEIKCNIKNLPNDYYQVVPINNVNLDKGIEIQDLLGNEEKQTYEKAYVNVVNDINKPLSDNIPTDVQYSNFSIYRNNGKWAFQGKLSFINPNTESYNFKLNIRQKDSINQNYTLVIPWKVLKGEIPMLVDAMTSPDGSMAIIVLKNSIEIYKIENGNIIKDSVRRIQLKDGEKVIMAEWCEGSSVEKWSAPFN